MEPAQPGKQPETQGLASLCVAHGHYLSVWQRHAGLPSRVLASSRLAAVLSSRYSIVFVTS